MKRVSKDSAQPDQTSQSALLATFAQRSVTRKQNKTQENEESHKKFLDLQKKNPNQIKSQQINNEQDESGIIQEEARIQEHTGNEASFQAPAKVRAVSFKEVQQTEANSGQIISSQRTGEHLHLPDSGNNDDDILSNCSSILSENLSLISQQEHEREEKRKRFTMLTNRTLREIQGEHAPANRRDLENGAPKAVFKKAVTRLYAKNLTKKDSRVMRLLEEQKTNGSIQKQARVNQIAQKRPRRLSLIARNDEPSRRVSLQLSDIWHSMGAQINSGELDAFQMLLEQAETEEDVAKIKTNMQVALNLIAKRKEQDQINKNPGDDLPVRWVLSLEDEPLDFDRDLLEETTVSGCKSNIQRTFYNCCHRKVGDDTNYHKINERSYFESMKSNLDKKVERDKQAIRNWQTIHLRLALFRNFRKKVAKDFSKCKCFSETRLKRMTGEERNDKKTWRHRTGCYLGQGKLNDEFRQLMTINVLEILLDEKPEIPWWQQGKYVLNPENITLQLWAQISGFIFFMSLMSSTLIICFDFWFLEKMRIYECFFDLIMLSDIILVFFTASEIPIKNESGNKDDSVSTKDVFQRYEYDNWKIARAYMKKFLITDIVACIPTLFTLNQNQNLYYLKLFKLLQIFKVFEQGQIAKRVLVNRFMKDKISFHNMEQILKSSLLAFIWVHFFTCGWIRIGVSSPSSWIFVQNGGHHDHLEYGFNEPIQDQYEDKAFLQHQAFHIYCTSFYFVTATMARVGYGDYKAVIAIEKGFCILMSLLSFCVFGYLIGNERNRKKVAKLHVVLADAKIDVENYIYTINKSQCNRGRKIDPQYYDIISDFVLQQLQHSQVISFQKNKFYQNLPPKLKTRIVEETLRANYIMFQFFFNDSDQGATADRVFVRKILSSLQSKVYMPGSPIIQAGQYVNEMFFVQKRSVLISDLFLRFNIVQLTPGSFFGEHELLFNVPSQFNYTASDQAHSSHLSMNSTSWGTWVFTCPKEKFLRYCDDFAEYAFILRERATVRRSFWRKIELEYEEQISYDLEKAQIIHPDEDEADFMDPLHKENYNEWKSGKVPEDPILNELRALCVTEASTSIAKMKYSNFNPMSPRFRIQLLQIKYTQVTNFQQHEMEIRQEKMPGQFYIDKVLKLQIPQIRLSMIYSLQLHQQTFLAWNLTMKYLTGRMQGLVYSPRLLSRFSTTILNQMLKEQSLHIRGKMKFKKSFMDLLYLKDTDDEKMLDEYQRDNQHQTTLDIPQFLVQIRDESSPQRSQSVKQVMKNSFLPIKGVNRTISQKASKYLRFKQHTLRMSQEGFGADNDSISSSIKDLDESNESVKSDLSPHSPQLHKKVKLSSLEAQNSGDFSEELNFLGFKREFGEKLGDKKAQIFEIVEENDVGSDHTYSKSPSIKRVNSVRTQSKEDGIVSLSPFKADLSPPSKTKGINTFLLNDNIPTSQASKIDQQPIRASSKIKPKICVVKVLSSSSDDGKADALDAVMWTRKKNRKKQIPKPQSIEKKLSTEKNGLPTLKNDLRPVLYQGQDERSSQASLSQVQTQLIDIPSSANNILIRESNSSSGSRARNKQGQNEKQKNYEMYMKQNEN